MQVLAELASLRRALAAAGPVAFVPTGSPRRRLPSGARLGATRLIDNLEF